MENLSYTIVSLSDLLYTYNYDVNLVQKELNNFSCLLNRDVECFIKEKAIVFDRQGWSRTHLVYTSYKDEFVLVAYFTLANKNFVVKSNANISRTLKKRIAKFGQYNDELKQYVVSSILIGQLGKNDRFGFLLKGDRLLACVFSEIRKVQKIIGGRFVYLECEDKIRLIDFYRNNGFVEFGSRNLEVDEKDDISGQYLIQMLKYLD